MKTIIRLKYFKLLHNALLAGVLLSTVLSCERAFIDSDPSSSAESVFEYLWTEVDENYSYLYEKSINWDSVHTVFKNQISDDLSNEDLFLKLSEMLDILEDAHVNLISSFNVSGFNFERGFNQNYNKRLLRDFYLDPESDSLHQSLENGTSYTVENKAFNTGAIPNLVCFVNGDSIGYIRYADFTYEITERDINYVLKRLQHTKGIVIDIRDNYGGNPDNLFRLLSRFIRVKKFMYKTYVKNGPERDNFSNGERIYLDPAGAGHSTYFKPVRILTNRSCYSASSFFCAGAYSFSKDTVDIKLVGDYTGGGAGAPAGGQLPNGWYYRLSVTKSVIDLTETEEALYPNPIISKNMFDFENMELHFENGVPPHILVNSNAIDYNLGRDRVFETAMVDIIETLQ